MHLVGKILPVDLDLECSAILPVPRVATVAAYQLPELSELDQREVLTGQMGHLAVTDYLSCNDRFGNM